MAISPEEQSYFDNLQEQTSQLQTKNTELNSALAASNFQSQDDKNLIEYQLDASDMIGRIEHFLKGEVVGYDDEGNQVWKKQENEDLVLFNDYGVNSIMTILGSYIDKNTILSNYDEMRINEILADFGEEVAIFIFCNYEKMGMDTEFKKTRFGLTVMTIIHGVESAYRKSLGGWTSRELNSSRIYTQSDLRSPSMGMNMPKKKFNLFKPRTW